MLPGLSTRSGTLRAPVSAADGIDPTCQLPLTAWLRMGSTEQALTPDSDSDSDSEAKSLTGPVWGSDVDGVDEKGYRRSRQLVSGSGRCI